MILLSIMREIKPLNGHKGGEVKMALSRHYHVGNLRRLNTHITTPNSEVNLDFTELGNRLDEAQAVLDDMILEDMIRYMPGRNGRLIQETRALNSDLYGEVAVYPPDLPYGHYQWEGEKYVNPNGGPNYKGNKLVPSGEALHYPSNLNAEAHWDEAAIRDNKDKWLARIQNMFS